MTAQQAPWADGTLVTTPTMTAIMQALGLDPLNPVADGWCDDNVIGGWVYQSANQFGLSRSLNPAQAPRYPIGAKLSCTDAGVTKYGYVTGGGTAASYWLFNAVWALLDGTATTLSGGAITNPRISYMATPYGFPTYVNFAASPVGISPITTNVAQLAVNGRQATIWFNFIGTGNAAGRSFTAPIASAAATPLAVVATKDNGNNTSGLALISASTVTIYYNAAFAGWTSSGATQTQGTLTYPI